jgi:hypothetical protein
MNIAKNMEAIFVVSLALASVTSVASASAAGRFERAAVVAAAAETPNIAVVVVTGKRMTKAEKAAFNG